MAPPPRVALPPRRRTDHGARAAAAGRAPLGAPSRAHLPPLVRVRVGVRVWVWVWVRVRVRVRVRIRVRVRVRVRVANGCLCCQFGCSQCGGQAVT
eukprot:scaffold21791_cov55-Phaeocystis_antarctica.AAC.1